MARLNCERIDYVEMEILPKPPQTGLVELMGYLMVK